MPLSGVNPENTGKTTIKDHSERENNAKKRINNVKIDSSRPIVIAPLKTWQPVAIDSALAPGLSRVSPDGYSPVALAPRVLAVPDSPTLPNTARYLLMPLRFPASPTATGWLFR
jgi:hypothetical protein